MRPGLVHGQCAGGRQTWTTGWRRILNPKAPEPLRELPGADANGGTHHRPDPSRMIIAVHGQGADVPRVPEPWYTVWYIICAGQIAFVPPDHMYHVFSAFHRATSGNFERAPLHPCSSGHISTDHSFSRICRSEDSSSTCLIGWIPASSGVQKRLHPAPRGAGIDSGRYRHCTPEWRD